MDVDLVLDLNMVTAYRIAGILFHSTTRPTTLPHSLEDVRIRAKLLDPVNRIILSFIDSTPTPELLSGQILAFPEHVINEMLYQIAETTRPVITDLDGDIVKIGISLCMWTGCIEGAKTLSQGTNDGINTPQIRKHNCENQIDLMSRLDPLYCAGAETAPIYKKIIGQSDDIFFDGVPRNSP